MFLLSHQILNLVNSPCWKFRYMLFDLVGFFIFRNQLCFVCMSVVDVSLCKSSLFKWFTLFWLFKFNICLGIFSHSLYRTTLHIQLVIATFRALCAISKRQTVMSQELLICENNIMQLSHFHIQDIKDSMSLFYYLYLWTFHSDYLMYHLSFYSHCSNSYIYVRKLLKQLLLPPWKKDQSLKFQQKTFNYREILKFLTLFYSFLASF